MNETLPRFVNALAFATWRAAAAGWPCAVDSWGMRMRSLVVVVAVLFSAAAFAQGGQPMVGDKPLVQVKPRGAPRGAPAPAKSQSVAVRLQACLDIEDGTKGRLDCY